MATPEFKCFNPEGEYKAAVRHLEDAAILVSAWGPGATIRWGHDVIVWTEGGEDADAGESFDHVAEVAIERLRQRSAVRAQRDGYDQNDLSVRNRYLPRVARYSVGAHAPASDRDALIIARHENDEHDDTSVVQAPFAERALCPLCKINGA